MLYVNGDQSIDLGSRSFNENYFVASDFVVT